MYDMYSMYALIYVLNLCMYVCMHVPTIAAHQLSRPFSDPEHVRRAVVPSVGDGVLSGQGLLVRQQQTLVRRVEVALRECGGPVWQRSRRMS